MSRRKKKTSRFLLKWSFAPPAAGETRPSLVALTTLARWPDDTATILNPAESYVFEVYISKMGLGFRGVTVDQGGNGTIPKMTRRERLVIKSMAQAFYRGTNFEGHTNDCAWIE